MKTKIMEFISEYHGLIGLALILIGAGMMFNSLVNTKIEMYKTKIELEKLKEK